jgi:hypothetical protein
MYTNLAALLDGQMQREVSFLGILYSFFGFIKHKILKAAPSYQYISPTVAGKDDCCCRRAVGGRGE